MTAITTRTTAFSTNITASRVHTRLTPMRAAAQPHGFADNLESALTGIVSIAVLLFAAGLLRGAIPACTWRTDGISALYALAALVGIFILACTVKALFHLGRTMRG